MSNLLVGQGSVSQQRGSSASIALDDDSGLSAARELMLLREENAELRSKMAELDQLLNLAIQDSEDRIKERQREYESLLEEKSEVIRALHAKNTELREHASTANAAYEQGQPLEQQDLLRLQRDLIEDRRQMEEDQEAMMAQMRQMEMALAKDRAELARQRNELQRLHEEVKHEVENAARDGGLRERLVAIQRRSHNNSTVGRPSVSQDTPLSTPLPKAVTSGDKITKSGLFRRLFGT